jgi:hypothetical protein
MYVLYFNESIKVPKFRCQIALNYIYFITLKLIGFMFGRMNELFVVQVQYFDEVNQGRCGECGDEWKLARPRPNDEGGL